MTSIIASLHHKVAPGFNWRPGLY